MAEAAIFFDGKVRQTTNLSNITFNNKSGFVATFTFNQIKYTHLYKDKFNRIDINSPDVTAGYYDESKFLKYLVKDGISINDIPAAKLSLDQITGAALKDTVRVQYLKVTAPYNDFCTINKYTWSFDPSAKVLDDRDFTIILQPGYQLVPEKVPVSSVAENFHTKNIGLITSSDFTDDKNQGAYYLSLVALQIHRINRDIFPLFYQSTDLTNYITTQNIEWQTGSIFIQPSLQDVIDYFTNLTNFYNAAYANQLVIKAASEKTKLFWLAYCLSPSGLSVFSVYDKIYIITQAISTSKSFALYNLGVSIVVPSIGPNLKVSDAGWVSRISPKLILKIVESVTLVETQSDDFSAQLNSIGNFGINKDETLFEVIYNFLGDNQIGNLIGDNKTGRIVGGIFGNPDDRKNFITLLKKIWDTSIYNPRYNSPKYSLPANNNGVYPESYYMTDAGIQHYNPDSATVLFVFESTDTSDPISYTNSFDFSLERNKIIAYKILTIQIHDERPTSETSKTLYGSYDLYQPVSIIGYQPDLDIAMPQVNCFPLFFLYYANDYKEVKDADATIELLFNLALNFTGIGAVGDLEYLGYLKQISEFGKLAELPASKAVLSWAAVEGASSAVQLTAGNALAISIYVGGTTTDPQLKAFTSKLDLFLGVVCLGAICYHPYVKQRVALAAFDVNAEYEALKAAQIETNLSNDAINAVKAFTDLIDELIATMRDKLVNLQLTNPNTILSRFDALAQTKEIQLNFYYDFFNLNDNTLWNKLNEIYDISLGRTLVDDWQEIKYLTKYRSNIEFLECYRYIKNDTKLLKHIFEGEINNAGKGVGVHSIEAVDNGYAQINSTLQPPNLDGYYQVTVSVLDNGVPIVKNGFSTFFKDVWDKQRVVEEISFAFTNNKVLDKGNRWIGLMSDGNKCAIVILGGNTTIIDATTNIKTAFPWITF
ncbi:MAG: hypothetical protein JWR38_5261 [Mucilaginibacter sp.]|nr:hypothetical protein [Mucilaginibacter sp.]